jgi:hypothetical protein
MLEKNAENHLNIFELAQKYGNFPNRLHGLPPARNCGTYVKTNTRKMQLNKKGRKHVTNIWNNNEHVILEKKAGNI